jgi:hypothetical protein
LIMLLLGAGFWPWVTATLRSQTYYAPGRTWPDIGPNAGQPVRFIDMDSGEQWLWMGEWVGGVCLLAAATILIMALVTRLRREPVLIAAAALCALGALANAFAAAVLFRMNVLQVNPLFMLLLCGVCGYSLMRHKWGGALT